MKIRDLLNNLTITALRNPEVGPAIETVYFVAIRYGMMYQYSIMEHCKDQLVVIFKRLDAKVKQVLIYPETDREEWDGPYIKI